MALFLRRQRRAPPAIPSSPSAPPTCIRTFGDAAQKARFLPPMKDGRCAGTMALTEPRPGLGARRHPDLRGAAGRRHLPRVRPEDVHLRRRPDAHREHRAHGAGAHQGRAGGGARASRCSSCRNSWSTTTACRASATTSRWPACCTRWAGATRPRRCSRSASAAAPSAISSASRTGASAYMFQMMNEARISVGFLAAAIAYRGYALALDYARERPQGRLPSCKDPAVAAGEARRARRHPPDAARAEGDRRRRARAVPASPARCSRTSSTHPEPAPARAGAALLLDVLTPVVKSWPSKYGCQANDMAIQVLGGSGYIREYPLEQLYRDQRLNPIHEGAEGIQALDLLGRKVVMDGGAGYRAFQARGRERRWPTRAARRRPCPARRRARRQPAEPRRVHRGTDRADGEPTPIARSPTRRVYLDAFGRVVASWVWLRIASVACPRPRRGARGGRRRLLSRQGAGGAVLDRVGAAGHGEPVRAAARGQRRCARHARRVVLIGAALAGVGRQRRFAGAPRGDIS